MNQADKVLVLAFIAFLSSILAVLQFSEIIWTHCLLFVSEAALVGGIADWFAVKALFERPLGIPWHTALLPNSRPQFTNATIDLIQHEFFSKKNIIKKIHELNLITEGLQWIQPKHKTIFADRILSFLQTEIEKLDVIEISHHFGEKYTPYLCNMIRNKIQENATNFLENENFREQLLFYIIEFSREKLKGKQGFLLIKNGLKKIKEEEGSKSNISQFLLQLSEYTSIIDIEEGAEKMQACLLLALEKLSEKNSKSHYDLSLILQKTLKGIITHPEWNALLDEIFAEFKRREIIGKCLTIALANIKTRLQLAVNNKENDPIYLLSRNIIKNEIDKVLEKLKSNTEVRKKVDTFVMDIAMRAALQAQNMIADVVRMVMTNLSDVQLNSMVYSKVEKDLIWIRLNGSIVGGVIGFALFWIIEGVKWIR